jgi:hypothetical protein
VGGNIIDQDSDLGALEIPAAEMNPNITDLEYIYLGK